MRRPMSCERITARSWAAPVMPTLNLRAEPVELRMVGRPLADQLGRRARILDLVGRGAGEMVGGDVADAVAAGLDRVHVDVGQRLEDVRHVPELRPVELDVLPRGEVAVALVPALGDHRQLPQLQRVQRAVRDGDAQHVGVQLQVEPVAQPERQELLLGQRCRRCAARPGRGTPPRARARSRGRNRYSHTSEGSAWRPCSG